MPQLCPQAINRAARRAAPALLFQTRSLCTAKNLHSDCEDRSDGAAGKTPWTMSTVSTGAAH
ncbi:MAG: hypothetical protein O9296_14170 [Novosphingobium sp.]|nr:hypothetical protein [Novosphingobium sp.]